MYDETNVPGPEYRVRTVVRYVVTRYCHPYTHSGAGYEVPGGSTVVAECHTEQHAHEAANALAKAEAHFGATYHHT